MAIYETTLEDDNGAEFDVRVHYDYEPAEKQTLDHPGCEASINIYEVGANLGEVDYRGNIQDRWCVYWDETLEHHDKWKEDILESLIRCDDMA